MSIETWTSKYPVFIEGEFERLNLREVVNQRKEFDPKPFVWSARLSTGIFGLPDCPSGNSPFVPRGENEVLLAMGDLGLTELIDLGFLPCPTCHPENTHGFWDKVTEAVEFDYPEFKDVHQFLDRDLLPFDSRRVDWEALRPIIKSLPNRLYVPRGLQEGDLLILKARFELLRLKIPPVGYYDKTAPGRFAEYKLP